MILFFLNVFLFSSAFGNIEKIIRANIYKTGFYRPGVILTDSISESSVIGELIPILEGGSASQVDLIRDELEKYYLSLGYSSFLNKNAITDITFIPQVLSPELAYLLGFHVNIDPADPSNNLRFYPNLSSLNARFKILKEAARNIYKIPGSENIADIFFYSSSTKDFSNLKYLEQVALGGFPIATFLDDGGILAFHDLIHITQLIFPHSLIKGYSDFVKDFLAFLDFIYDKTLHNTLTHVAARMIDGEVGVFTYYLLRGCQIALDDTHKKLETNTDNHSFEFLYYDTLKKYALSEKEKVESYFLRFMSLKNSGQTPSISYSSGEAPNSFIERVNHIIDRSTYDPENEAPYLRLRLKRFLESDYGIEHNLKNKVYFTNGFELYKQTLEHLIFMKTLGDHEGIKKLLAFPKY